MKKKWLPKDEKQLVYLRDVERRSFKTIAKVLGRKWINCQRKYYSLSGIGRPSSTWPPTQDAWNKYVDFSTENVQEKSGPVYKITGPSPYSEIGCAAAMCTE